MTHSQSPSVLKHCLSNVGSHSWSHQSSKNAAFNHSNTFLTQKMRERERRKRSQQAKKSLQHLQLKKKKQTSSHTLHSRTYLDWFQLSSTLSAEQRNIISSHKLCVCRAQSNFLHAWLLCCCPTAPHPEGTAVWTIQQQHMNKA